MSRLLLATAALAACALPAAALAHDIWVVPVEADGKTVAQVRYADPARLELAERGKIISLEVISPAGRINLKRPLAAVTRGPAALQSGPFAAPAGAILAVAYDNGFWATDPADGVESNTTKVTIPTAKESWWVPKYGKTLLGPGSWKVRTNSVVEVVPLSDPYAAAPGKTLAVRLERKGAPLAGVKVVYGDGLEPLAEDKMPSVTTNKDGVAEIPLTRKGPYLLTTHHVGPSSFPALVDNDDVYASLAFDTSK